MRFQVKPIDSRLPNFDDFALDECSWLTRPRMFDKVELIGEEGEEQEFNLAKIRASLTRSSIVIARPGYSLLDPLVQLIGVHFAARGIGGNLQIVGPTAVEFETITPGPTLAEYEVTIKTSRLVKNYSPPIWKLRADGWARWGDLLARAKDLAVIVEVDE